MLYTVGKCECKEFYKRVLKLVVDITPVENSDIKGSGSIQ